MTGGSMSYAGNGSIERGAGAADWRRGALVAVVVAAVLVLGRSAGAQPALTTELVASGFITPLYVTSPRGDFNRLFVVEQYPDGQNGRISIINLADRSVNPKPFLTVGPVAQRREEGLLGLAFHPDYLLNGYFWVYYVDAANNIRVVRYRAKGQDFRASVEADPET